MACGRQGAAQLSAAQLLVYSCACLRQLRVRPAAAFAPSGGSPLWLPQQFVSSSEACTESCCWREWSLASLQIRIKVHRAYSLQEAPAAYAAVVNREAIGKVLIVPPGGEGGGAGLAAVPCGGGEVGGSGAAAGGGGAVSRAWAGGEQAQSTGRAKL